MMRPIVFGPSIVGLLSLVGACANTVAPDFDAGPPPGGSLPTVRVDAGTGGGSGGGGSGGGGNPGPGPVNDAGSPAQDAGIPPPVTSDGGTDPSYCGNGRVESGEICDGDELRGLTCRGLGWAGGSLGCKDTCLDFDLDGCIPLSPTPIAAPGASIELTGSLDATAATWQRPTENCGASGSQGHAFAPLAIVNPTGLLRSVRITANFAGNGFLHLYQTRFSAIAPLSDCVAGSGDLDGLTTRSGFVDVPMPPGTIFVLVASTEDAGDLLGTFSISVETQGESAVCGNGILEPGEVCDGATLGGISCETRGYDRGMLQCAPDCLTLDESACENDPAPAPTPIAAPGGSVGLTGSLDTGDGRWSRPGASCSGANADRVWDSHLIINQTGAPQRLRITATWNDDGFLHVYRAAFEPTSPLTGCVVGDDDYNGLLGSQVEDVEMGVGEILVLVASSYAADDPIGAYSLDVATQTVAQCGDGVREGTEVCDGADLEGESCFGLGFSGGRLACQSGCSEFERRDCFSMPAAIDIASPGSSVTLAGTLDGNDPTWTRATTACGSTTSSGRYFDVFAIRNGSVTAQEITLNATWSGDNLLYIFNETFDSVAPTAGCIVGNDDAGSATRSALEGQTIAAGETLVVVASSYGTSPTGSYSIEVRTEQGAVCGNGVVEGTEACDGAALASQSCSSRGYAGGTLRCDACQLIETDCFDFAPQVTIALPGGFVDVSGALTETDPRWDRPTETCGGTEGPSDHPFDAIPVINQTGSPQVIEVTATFSSDGFLHAFNSDFEASSSRQNCLMGNDDFGSSSSSQLAALPIAAGQTLVVVPSAFVGGSFIGDYSIRVRTKSASARPIGTPGTAIQLTGSLDNTDPVWNRLNQSCGTLDNPGRHYDVHRIVNETDALQDLTITGNWSDGDGFLHLTLSSFDPENPVEDDCLRGDDDFGFQESRFGSRIESASANDDDQVNIYPGEELLVIVSAFAANTPIGAYTVEVFTGSTDASPPVAAELAPPGQSFITHGTLHVTDDQWDRPTQCNAQAGGPVDHFYDAHYLKNSTQTSKDIQVTATWAEQDGGLQLYLGDLFDPASPGTCLASSDDFGGPGQSRLTDFLLAGETLTVVASAVAGNTPIGPYTLEVLTLP